MKPFVGNWLILLCSIIFFSEIALSAGTTTQFQLADCPARPNCVSTQALNKDHALAPLQFSKAPSEVLEIIKLQIRDMDRASLVKQSELYLLFEFRSRIFGFVDDVEFRIDPTSSLVHIRSASRTGYSDFGVNRKRVELIRSLLAGKL